MEITNIRIFKAKKRGPSRLLVNEKRKSYRDVCHPLNTNIRNELTETIFKAYDEFIENSESEEE